MTTENSLEIYDQIAFGIHEAYIANDSNILMKYWGGIKNDDEIWEKWVESPNKCESYTTILGDNIQYIDAIKFNEDHYFKINGVKFWERKK
jgi:hypothetical protein